MAGVLHVFNPGHDLVLASGKGIDYCPPHAARQLQHDLGFLPAFWAQEGDVILVDDVRGAAAAAADFAEWLPQVKWVTLKQLLQLKDCQRQIMKVLPWGWDKMVAGQLSKVGVIRSLLPDDRALDGIRRCSGRQASVPWLQDIVDNVRLTVGERWVTNDINQVRSWLRQRRTSVIKSPWSSSGRGVRFTSDILTVNEEGFVRNVIAQQGCVIIEPYYPRVMDFALEFETTQDGSVNYSGLSVFTNDGTAYTGGILASEEEKMQMLRQYLPEQVICEVRDFLMTSVAREMMQKDSLDDRKALEIPWGVDMMVVSSDEGYRLHPLVELNYRRTMGHVALSVAERTKGHFSTMQISMTNGTYSLSLK